MASRQRLNVEHSPFTSCPYSPNSPSASSIPLGRQDPQRPSSAKPRHRLLPRQSPTRPSCLPLARQVPTPPPTMSPNPRWSSTRSTTSSWNSADKWPVQSSFLSHLNRTFRRKLAIWFPPDKTTLARHSRTSSLSPVPSPTTLKFISQCCIWYASSAMSSNTGKSIMNRFRYPVTLTFVQFFFVASFCALFMSPLVRFSKFRPPTRAIFNATLPMGAFQVGGHIFSSMAISRIPVSTVHTIKALSPLFTVAAYAVLFNVSYSANTYLSLLPLTLGVMLVCTFDVSGSNLLGLSCAFGSALIFVSSNIFFKKVMPSGNQPSSHKLDKLNLLFYSSGMAFILMIPVWLYYDFPKLMAAYYAPKHYTYLGGDDEKEAAALHSVIYYFFLNGTVHFAQNIIAFIILASTSPVTYSIASLIKRVAVICIAILWFAQPVHPIQAIGIVMTFGGLYMYNQAKGDVEKGEHKMRRVEAARDMRLPVTKGSTDHLVTTLHPNVINVSVTSARDRSWTSPVRTHPIDSLPLQSLEIVSPNTQPPPNIPHQPHNLHTKVHPPSVLVPSRDCGLNASYPSPPESVDSPPSSPPLSNGPRGTDFDSWMSRRALVVPVQ